MIESENWRKKTETVAKSWSQAGELLGFEVASPYSINLPNGELLLCVARLDHFGSQRGMLIWIDSDEDRERINPILINAAKAKNMFYSIVNPQEYARYDEAVFLEALRDWNYFGPSDSQPDWIL